VPLLRLTPFCAYSLAAGKEIKAGDVILGLASSGVHSNGFSLVRKVLEVAGTSLHDPAPWGGDNAQPAGLELLTPTVIYVKQVMELHEKVRLTPFDIFISIFAGRTHALEPNFGMLHNSEGSMDWLDALSVPTGGTLIQIVLAELQV
jgi:hypothetical protein